MRPLAVLLVTRVLSFQLAWSPTTSSHCHLCGRLSCIFRLRLSLSLQPFYAPHDSSKVPCVLVDPSAYFLSSSCPRSLMMTLQILLRSLNSRPRYLVHIAGRTLLKPIRKGEWSYKFGVYSYGSRKGSENEILGLDLAEVRFLPVVMKATHKALPRIAVKYVDI